MKKSSRRSDDPINCIKISCKIPQSLKYNVGSMDVFNYGEELEKMELIKYAEILKIEN